MGGPWPEHGTRSLWYQDLTPQWCLSSGNSVLQWLPRNRVLLSLRPPRSHVANDKRSLPQSAQSCWGERMEPMRARVLCFGAIDRRLRVDCEALESCSVILFSLRPLRPLRPPRSRVANDKRSLPQSAQSCGEKVMEPMRARVLCCGTSGRRSRVHREASEHWSVTLLSLRPLR
jgi:hypothetical protein